MTKIELKNLEMIRNIGLEDIGTGGGCYGFYLKRGKYTYYLTTMSELTLPLKSGLRVSLSVYDKDFEHQFLTYTINDFRPSRIMNYILMVERKMKSKKVQKELKNKPEEIIYLP